MEKAVEFFLKHKKTILRTVGSIMLVVGFAIHFWVTPKEGYTKEQLAAANVARMEAQIKGTASGAKTSPKKDTNKFLEELKKTQEQQMKYLTILAMLFGIGFLGYSFLKKEPKD